VPTKATSGRPAYFVIAPVLSWSPWRGFCRRCAINKWLRHGPEGGRVEESVTWGGVNIMCDVTHICIFLSYIIIKAEIYPTFCYF